MGFQLLKKKGIHFIILFFFYQGHLQTVISTVNVLYNFLRVIPGAVLFNQIKLEYFNL